MRTALVLMTHRFDAPILDEFARMRLALRESDRAFVLSDAAALPEVLAAHAHRFSLAGVAPRAKRLVGSEIMWNLHLAWLDFFDAQDGFDRYWFIEYDALYAGPWRDLFDAFRDQPHDLLCAHLRPHADEPDWHWWHEIRAPDGGPDPASCVRGFLPIARLSRAGFNCLRDAVQAGWTGFFEGLLPTVLHRHGLGIGDLGGDGPFVPDGFRNRFYRSVSDRAGTLQNLGSHRYRPPLAYPRIVPGRIYHPVKPEACLVDAGADAEHAGAAIGNLLEQVRRYRLHRDTPLDTLLQAYAGIDSAELRERIAQLLRDHADDARYGLLHERMRRLTETAA